jgi:hypothetical protein
MLRVSNEESPRQSLYRSWPLELFGTPRYFDRKAENQPYIEWLRDWYRRDTVEDTLSDDDEGGEEEGAIGEVEEEEAEEGFEFPRNGFDLSRETEDETPEKICQGTKDDDNNVFGQRNIVRLFMEGMVSDEEDLPYQDQVDVVAGWYEQAVGYDVDKNAAILLDDRTRDDEISRNPRQSRPWHGPLSSKQLREELSKPVSLFQTAFPFQARGDSHLTALRGGPPEDFCGQ